MKNLLYKLIRTAELDKKSVNNRLGEIKSRHAEISAVFAPSRSVIPPTQRLFDIFSKLILEAPRQSDALFRQRKNVPDYVFDFPGEHYKVLQALTSIIRQIKKQSESISSQVLFQHFPILYIAYFRFGIINNFNIIQRL